jgi:hypothetical protein
MSIYFTAYISTRPKRFFKTSGAIALVIPYLRSDGNGGIF